MKEKVRSELGAAKLVVVLLIIAIGLFVLAAVPIVQDAYEARLEKDDENFKVSAERMAKHDYIELTDDEIKVYDGVNKTFVEPSEFKSIDPYASSRLHKDDYLVIFIGDDGEIESKWMSGDSIEELAEGRN